MRNVIFVLLGIAAAWWYLSGTSTQAVVLPDGGLSYPDYRIDAVEAFSIEARVLSRRDYRSGREADLSPTDLALGWGPMSQDRILEHFDIGQSNRWFTWRADSLPISRAEIASSAANMHLIPASEAAAEQLARVREGDRIRVQGHLVDVTATDGWRWRTSRSRSDTGQGACELILLDRIVWL